MAYTFHSHAVGLRDLGPSQAPFNAWLTMLGIETLGLRMERHCANAQKVAEYLAGHPAVAWVNYAGLPANKYHSLAKKYLPKGAGSIFTFGVKGGYDVGVKVVDSVELFSHLANIGDAKSLIIHPASTTHRQLSDEQRVAAGAGPDVLRLSIGIETVDDIIADLEQALDQSDFLMLSQTDNELLTRSGTGTPMGELLRRFWMPALLVEGASRARRPAQEDQDPGRGAARLPRVRRQGRHRRAALPAPRRQLYYGRNEECGLRCAFHGWKFDIDGNCVDLPTSPPESAYKDTIKLLAYPTREWADMIWVYMGPREHMPELPQLEMGLLPAASRYVTKKWQRVCTPLDSVMVSMG